MTDSSSFNPNHQTFILEEILTLSSLVDLEQTNQDSDVAFNDDGLLSAISSAPPITESLEAFESGIFQVTGNGEVKFDFLFDGGGYKGELGIFSLEGMDTFDPNSTDFIQEAAQRVSSGTDLGHIVISDPSEGAKFSSSFNHEGDFNAGDYLGPKPVKMKPGDRFGLMLVPNGRFQEVLDNPEVEGAARPLFSMATANPEDHFHVKQLLDVTGDGNTFTFEDLRIDTGSDEDYNDLVFRIEGARGQTESLDEYINPDDDWRETVIGQEIIEYAQSFVEPDELIVMLDPSGATEIEIEQLFVTLPKSGEWTYEVVDAGSPELNLSLEGQTLLVEPTSAEIDIEQIAIRATNGNGESIIQRPILILDVPDSETTEAIDKLLIEVKEVLETLAKDTNAGSSEGLTNLVDTLDSLIEKQPRAFKFLVQPDTLLALGIDQPQVDAAYQLIHSEMIGQELGLPDSLYEALKKAGSSAWEKLLVEAHDLAELPPYQGLLPLIGFIEFAQQGHDRKTLQTFNAIHQLDDDAYTVKYTDGADWAEKLTELVDQAISSETPNAVVNLGLDLAQFDNLEHTTTRYELTPAEQQAIQYAQENNVLLVTAAGNTGDLMSALGAVAQKFDNILVVGAVDRWQEKADYSAQGEGLSLVAPGGEWETDPNAFVGTSKATAYVTAAVSLLWKANPELNYQQVKEILLKAADDLAEPGWDPATGAGLLDVAEAIILAQQTEGTELTVPNAAPVDSFSGEGRVTTLARPASDPQDVSSPLLEVSDKANDDLWQQLLGVDETRDFSVGQYAFEVLNEYQELKTEVEGLAIQEQQLENNLALLEQETQVKLNKRFVLETHKQTLIDDLEKYIEDKEFRQTPNPFEADAKKRERNIERITELETLIINTQQRLGDYRWDSPKGLGIKRELDSHELERLAIDDWLNLSELERAQDLELINLKVSQKQHQIDEINSKINSAEEEIGLINAQARGIPNELKAIHLAQDDAQARLRELLEIAGFAIPYRERIEAIEGQIEYLNQRLEQVDPDNVTRQEKLQKELISGHANLSTISASGLSTDTIEALIEDIQTYQQSSSSEAFLSQEQLQAINKFIYQLEGYQWPDSSDDLPAQQYVEYLNQVLEGQQAYSGNREILAEHQTMADLAYTEAKQFLEKLWDEHTQLNQAIPLLKDIDPEIEYWHPDEHQSLQEAIINTEKALQEKYQSIELTERYLKQIEGFTEKLNHREAFLVQLEGEAQQYQEQAQEWENVEQEQEGLTGEVLETLEVLESTVLRRDYVSAQTQLTNIQNNLTEQNSLLDQLFLQDELLKEEQAYYYNLSLEHKANTWSEGFYSESEALAERENYQQASLIADQRNKLWAQIQSLTEDIDDLESQRQDVESQLARIRQELEDLGQEIPDSDTSIDFDKNLTEISDQLESQLAELEAGIIESSAKWADFDDDMQSRAESIQKLIAFGLAASESNPEYFYAEVETIVLDFLAELQQQYQSIESHKNNLLKILETLQMNGLEESVNDLNFLIEHISNVDIWQSSFISVAEDLRGLLNNAWSTLAFLQERRDLEKQLLTPRPELVTLDKADAALGEKSIQSYAQLHDSVADDLVDAVTKWTTNLQASYQITQDLIEAQSQQSDSVDSLVNTIQSDLSGPFGDYKTTRDGLRDLFSIQSIIKARNIKNNQEIKRNRAALIQLSLKKSHYQDSLANWESELSYYTQDLNLRIDNVKNSIAKLLPSFENTLKDTEERLGSIKIDLDAEIFALNKARENERISWHASRNYRVQHGWPDDSSPDVVDGFWNKRVPVKGPFGLITWTTEVHPIPDPHWDTWKYWSNEVKSHSYQVESLRFAFKSAESTYAKFVDIVGQWSEAHDAARRASEKIDDVADRLKNIRNKRKTELELSSEEEIQSLLETLEKQALEAQQEALSVQASVEQAWETYLEQSQAFGQAATQVVEQRSQVDRQALQYRSMLAEIERWIEGQSISINTELQQAITIKQRLEEALAATQDEISLATSPSELTELQTKVSQLQQSLALAVSKLNVTEAQQASLAQRRELVAASDAVVAAETKLLQAYILNPDQDTSILEAELLATREALAEAQRLAEQAEASSQALTQPLKSLREDLLAKNDRHIQEARLQQQTLRELREATEEQVDLTLQATEKQREINTIEFEITNLLQQAKDLAENERKIWLDRIRAIDSASAAEVAYRQFNDLASDNKTAKPEYQELADQYYQEWRRLEVLDIQKNFQAIKLRNKREQAEANIEILQRDTQIAQQELDKINNRIAQSQEEIEHKNRDLELIEIRIKVIEEVRVEAEQTFIQVANLEQLNLAQAQLEIEIAKQREAGIDQSLENWLARERQAIERKRQVVLAQIEQLEQVQAEADLQQALNEIRGSLGMTDLDVVESPVQMQSQMASLLGQLDVLETEEPDLPDDLKALLIEVKGDIHLALQGEEAANIQANIIAAADGIVEQINRYKAELAEIDAETQKEGQLLQQAQTNLEAAVKTFFEEAEKNEEIRVLLDELDAEYSAVLAGIYYAEGQVAIAEERARLAREAIEQVIARREEIRKQRKKAVWSKVLSTLSTVVSLVGTVVSFVPGLQVVGIGLIAAGAGINAIQSAINGDWAGAAFGAVMAGVSAVTAGAGNLIGSIATRSLQGLQAATSGAFNGIRSIKTGESVLGALQILGGAAGAATQGLQNVFSQLSSTGSKVMQSVLNGLEKAPQMIYDGIDAIKDGDWFAAVEGLFNGAISISTSFSSFFNDAVDTALKYVDKTGNTGLALAGAISTGGINAWLSGIDSLLGTWDEEIRTAVDEIADKDAVTPQEDSQDNQDAEDDSSRQETLEKRAEEVLASVEDLPREDRLLALSDTVEDLPDDVAATVIEQLDDPNEQISVLAEMEPEKANEVFQDISVDTKKKIAAIFIATNEIPEQDNESGEDPLFPGDSINNPQDPIAGALEDPDFGDFKLTPGNYKFEDDVITAGLAGAKFRQALSGVSEFLGEDITGIKPPKSEEMEFLAGALLGEFNRNPSSGQVFLGTMIDILDPTGATDIRDLKIIYDKFQSDPSSMDEPLNWVNAAGSLIGLAPGVGGVAKQLVTSKPVKSLFERIQNASLKKFFQSPATKSLIEADKNLPISFDRLSGKGFEEYVGFYRKSDRPTEIKAELSEIADLKFKVTGEYGFEVSIPGSLKAREFDGAKGNVWWDAKHPERIKRIGENPKLFNDFKSQASQHSATAERFNKKFEIHSSSIPNNVKAWLDQKGIAYKEIKDNGDID
ncbi:MAG: DUF4114 domain-containing protein [Cyanobacteria bacterium P01_D01_bin.156]